jgi:hypothetical protein
MRLLSVIFPRADLCRCRTVISLQFFGVTSTAVQIADDGDNDDATGSLLLL